MTAHSPQNREVQYALTMQHYVEPILPYLSEREVSEIYTNPATCEVWIGTTGGREATGIRLPEVHIQAFLNTCAERQNETLNQKNEHIQAQLPLPVFRGARLQGVTPRIVERPCFNIRKRASTIYSLQEYLDAGSLCSVHYQAIQSAIRDRKNILVFGGMGSGKTTLVNAILDGMVDDDPTEDFLILEDTQELQCRAEGTRYLTQTNANSLRDLVKLTKRMFPGRVIVGEVRDEAALDLMNAWTSGHPGGSGTVHASSPIGALRKMASLARWAADTDHTAMVAEAIDLVVGIERTTTGRIIRHVAWVDDELGTNGDYILRTVLRDSLAPGAQEAITDRVAATCESVSTAARAREGVRLDHQVPSPFPGPEAAPILHTPLTCLVATNDAYPHSTRGKSDQQHHLTQR